MATIHICDGCRKQISSLNLIRLWGNTKLNSLAFCKECFKTVEEFIIEKFEIETKERKYAQG